MKTVLTIVGIILLIDAILCSYGIFRLPIRPKARNFVNWVVIPVEMLLAFVLFKYESLSNFPMIIICAASCYIYAFIINRISAKDAVPLP